jgi:hypothetical protein
MKFEIEPFGKEYRFDQESDIIELNYGITGLRLTVIAATTLFTNIYLDIHFSNVSGFRFLDEEDLIAYWENDGFKSNHHIYKILSGGWSNGEPLPDGIMSVHSSFESAIEWFIATTNGCINIISGTEPSVKKFSNNTISSK